MSINFNVLERATNFFNKEVIPWYRDMSCGLNEKLAPHLGHLLLAGIYLSVLRLLEVQQFGANQLDIRAVKLVASADATRIVDTERNGRVRKVTLWIDAATGGPVPTIRISTSGSGAAGGGIRVLPGQANALGEVPASVKLYAASSQNVNLYVLEVA